MRTRGNTFTKVLTESSGGDVGGEEDGLCALAEVVVDGHPPQLMQGPVERQDRRRATKSPEQLAGVLHLFATLDNRIDRFHYN